VAPRASKRGSAAGILNVALVLLWVGLALWLMEPAVQQRRQGDASYALFIIGAPLACFVAYRMSTLRLVFLLLLAGGLGYVKEFVASAARVWDYPAGGPGLQIAMLMGFGGIGTYALAYFLDEVLRVRRLLSLRNKALNSLLVFSVFGALLLLLAFEDGGAYGRAAVTSPPFLIFYLLQVLIAWFFARHARLGRILVTMFASGAASWVGLYLGIQDGLWFFAHGKPLLFDVVGGWPLEFFVQYSLAAALSELLEARVAGRRVEKFAAIRGALDKMVLWAARPPECLVGLALFAVLPLLARADGLVGPSRWAFAFLPAGLYLIALAASHCMYRLRVYWLLGLGALLGLAVEACRFWSYDAPADSYYFMVPVWALLAVATYGLAARLARSWWVHGEWRRLDRGGWLPGLIAGLMLAAVGAVWFFTQSGGLAAGNPSIAGLAVVFTFAVAAVVAGAFARLAAAIPLILLVTGYLFADGYLQGAMHVLPGLLFAALTAHLGDIASRELRTRTMVAVVLASCLLGMVVQAVGAGTGVFVHLYGFPWFFVLGLGPLVLGACVSLSASAAGEVLNKRPVRGIRLLRKSFELGPWQLPERSIVAVVGPEQCGACSQPERARYCLQTGVKLLAQALGYQGGSDFISHFVGKGERVFVKPNVVLPMYSPCAVLPELVGEVARLCVKEAGASLVRIGETSLSDFTARQTLVSTGFQEYWESVDPKRVKVTLLDESDYLPVEKGSEFYPHFRSLPRWLSCSECDRYINISKLKTHYITSVTLSIKNSLGLIPDEEKAIEHRGIRGVNDLARKLVMITKARPPDLVIIDGFDGLEGDGPFVGDRVDTEFVIVSNDPVAADAVAATMMGRNKNQIATCTLGASQGLGRNNWQDITIITPAHPTGGVSPGSLPVRHFKAPRPPLGGKYQPGQPPGEEEWIGSIRLIAQDDHDAHAGPESTLYGVLSIIRPLAEVYLVSEWKKLKGLTIAYGAVKEPIECESAMLFGDRAISSQHWVYAPEILQIPGDIPNTFLGGVEELTFGADVDVAKLLVSALRQSKGDYL
jgi:uncharacterized protein (DUF362 family)